MNQGNSSSPPQPSLDVIDPQPEREEDIEEEFLKQNEMISQEIWKHDKSLNCPTRTFKFLAVFYVLGFADSVNEFTRGNTRNSFTFLPGYAFYLLFCVQFLLSFLSMWAFFILWRVQNLKNPSRLKTPTLIFKSYLCFAVSLKLPIFLYYLGWSSGFQPLLFTILRPLGDAIISGSSLLVVIWMRNILLKNRPFYEASSFYVNMT